MIDTSSTPEVSIVFTNWNTRDYMRDCINSVIEKTKGLTYEIIVVDDGSTDDSVEMLRREFPDVRQVINEKNLGVAKAYNRGVAQARGRYVQMLNTDMILINNAIKILFDFMESNPSAGACGSWLRNRDLTSQLSYGYFPTLSLALIDSLFLNEIFPNSGLPKRSVIPAEGSTSIVDVDYVTGASMMIRRSIIDTLGFFDEHFTSYCEELEFCYRVRTLTAANICFIPEAQIIHFGGASFDKVKKYQAQLIFSGYNKFMTKHHGAAYSLFARVLYSWHYSVKMLVRFARFILARPETREEKKRIFFIACYNIRYALFPNEQFTGK